MFVVVSDRQTWYHHIRITNCLNLLFYNKDLFHTLTVKETEEKVGTSLLNILSKSSRINCRGCNLYSRWLIEQIDLSRGRLEAITRTACCRSNIKESSPYKHHESQSHYRNRCTGHSENVLPAKNNHIVMKEQFSPLFRSNIKNSIRSLSNLPLLYFGVVLKKTGTLRQQDEKASITCNGVHWAAIDVKPTISLK